jgi:hypothetical protein
LRVPDFESGAVDSSSHFDDIEVALKSFVFRGEMRFSLRVALAWDRPRIPK